jgi:hypothetical protein
MKKIVDYRLIVGDDPVGLTNNIFYWIKYGWEPFGSPGYSGARFFQAVVKYE